MTSARTSRAGRSSARIVLAYLAVYLIWGSTYLAILYAVETLPSFLMGGVRFLVAGAFVYAWGLRRERRHPTIAQWREASVLGALFFLGGNGAVVWAETRVPSGVASLLVATMPLWIVVLDWLRPRGSRPSANVLVGLLLGFAGLVVLLPAGRYANGASVDPLGALVLVLGALSWAAGSLYAQSASLPKSLLLSSGMEMIAGGIWLTLAGLVAGEPAAVDPSTFSVRSLLALVYLIVFGSIIAFNAFTYLLENADPTRLSTYAYVNPVVAVLLGWLLAGEALTARTVTGAAVIVGAVAMVTIGQSAIKRGKKEELPAPIAELAEGSPPPQ